MNDPNENTPISWTTLLAHWTRMAQAAVALPKDAEGDRWRDSLAPLIALHATSCALSELDRIDPEDRAAALDKAEMLITRDATTLTETWREVPTPPAIFDTLEDARRVHALAGSAGYEWTCAEEVFVAQHPGELAGALAAAGFPGDLYTPAPGIPVFASTPIAFLRGPHGIQLDEDFLAIISDFLEGASHDPARVGGLRQTYRRFDFAVGGPVEDVVALPEGDPEPGQPLLVCALLEGIPHPVSLPPRSIQEIDPLPLRFVTEED